MIENAREPDSPVNFESLRQTNKGGLYFACYKKSKRGKIKQIGSGYLWVCWFLIYGGDSQHYSALQFLFI